VITRLGCALRPPIRPVFLAPRRAWRPTAQFAAHSQTLAEDRPKHWRFPGCRANN
jgi:hypothetical protein